MTDQELARRVQGGSACAFEELVYRYEQRIFAFASQFCRNREDAREVTQDTFVKAWQAMSQFDCQRDFAAWLFTIARHKAIDRCRAMPPHSECSGQEPTDDRDPGRLLANREEGEQLWRVARRLLADNHYQALWLRYAEDMDLPQIAQVLGKTRVHIKVMLFRARQTLSRELRLVSPRGVSRATEAPGPRRVNSLFKLQPLERQQEFL